LLLIPEKGLEIAGVSAVDHPMATEQGSDMRLDCAKLDMPASSFLNNNAEAATCGVRVPRSTFGDHRSSREAVFFPTPAEVESGLQ
jgi:hypothetical protein